MFIVPVGVDVVQGTIAPKAAETGVATWIVIEQDEPAVILPPDKVNRPVPVPVMLPPQSSDVTELNTRPDKAASKSVVKARSDMLFVGSKFSISKVTDTGSPGITGSSVNVFVNCIKSLFTVI